MQNEIFEMIKIRLKSFGYEVTEDDDFLINFYIKKAENYIKSFCNIKEVPVELFEIEVDMTVGYFLKEIKASNPTLIGNIDLTKNAKQITLGDTSYSYDTGEGTKTNEQRFDEVLNKMINIDEYLYPFKRLRW